jgi:hypothetical protein
LRYFFAPQAGRSPPVRGRHAGVGGRDARPPGAEKIAQFLSPDLVVVHRAEPLSWYVLYQYKQ